jgi:hypothetical protein
MTARCDASSGRAPLAQRRTLHLEGDHGRPNVWRGGRMPCTAVPSVLSLSVTRSSGRTAGGCPSIRRHTSRRLRFPSLCSCARRRCGASRILGLRCGSRVKGCLPDGDSATNCAWCTVSDGRQCPRALLSRQCANGQSCQRLPGQRWLDAQNTVTQNARHAFLIDARSSCRVVPTPYRG